jgi:predicted DNA-binding transcriptional regulator AlpA
MTAIDARARLLFRKDVAHKTGIRPHTLEMLIRSGRFPAPVRLGHRRAWWEPDIEDWLAVRFAERQRKTMMVSELIAKLRGICRRYGDLPLIGGYLTDSSGLHSVEVLDRDGCVCDAIGSKPHGVFLQ